jgi:hypothetical protein
LAEAQKVESPNRSLIDLRDGYWQTEPTHSALLVVNDRIQTILGYPVDEVS